MDKKQAKKDEIIRKAVEMFAIYGYENVSISDFQYAMDMGRGSLYYYFKSKDDVFRAVMERYFLIPKEQVLNLPDTIDVPQMIDAMLVYLDSLRQALETLDNKNINTSNVIMLMFSAYSRFDKLSKQATALYRKELKLWNTAIMNSIKKGDVKKDIPVETVAKMFTLLKDSYDAAEYNVQMDFSIFSEIYNCLYKLIKT